MRVYEEIAKELSRRNVRKTFGLIGEDIAELLVACQDLGIEYYSSRQESAAVAMADGYARASGQLGVAVVSKGPGLLNAMNALTTAAKGESPLVLFAGDSAPGLSAVAQSRKGKFIDQAGVLDAAGIRHLTLASTETAAADVGKAIDLATQGATVVVNLPRSVFIGESGQAASQMEASADRPYVSRIRPIAPPDPDAINDVADLLETTWASRRPVILAGQGVVRAGAKGCLEQLGEISGSLMATTLLARSMFAGNPYDIDIMGSYSTPVASELLGQADVLLAFGASLNGRTTYGGQICPKARVVQFDSDPDAFERYPFMRPELRVLGDVGLSAKALVDELVRRGHQFSGYRTQEVAQRLAAFNVRDSFIDKANERGPDPRAVLLALDSLLPEDRTIVTDAGHHMSFEVPYLRGRDPSSWIYPFDFLSIGSATGVAIGAALARPERLTILCVGDGGMMMTIVELATAVRYEIPLVVLVNNDAAYGTDMHILEMAGFSGDVARSDDVSFVQIALGMGAKAKAIRSIEDVAEVAGMLEGLRGPLVVEYKVSNGVVAEHHFSSLDLVLPD